MDVYIGVDIGGSHISVGFIDTTGNILCSSEERIDDCRTCRPNQILDQIVNTIDYLSTKGHQGVAWNIRAVGVGCPGQAKDGVLVSASNFPLFRNFRFSDSLSKKLEGIPVVLINDTDAAIIAEVFGSGAYVGLRNAAMITLGTGIGLGLVIEGQLYQGSHGLIEGGHMIIEADASNGRSCPCGQIGCAEAYASAKSTSVRMFEVDADGGGGVNADAASVFSRAAAGDRGAQSILDETAEKLAILCINICRVVDPSVIILGGGMAKAGEKLVQMVEAHVKARAWTVLPMDVKIVTAQMSDNSGILGSALAARDHINRTESEKEAGVAKKKERVLVLKTVRPLIFNAAVLSLIAALGTATTITGRQSGALIRTTVMLAQTGFGIFCLAKWNGMYK